MTKGKIVAIIAACVLALVLAASGLLCVRYRQSVREAEHINRMERIEAAIGARVGEDLRANGVDHGAIRVELIEIEHPQYTGTVTHYDANGREVTRSLTVTVDERRDSFVWRLGR